MGILYFPEVYLVKTIHQRLKCFLSEKKLKSHFFYIRAMQFTHCPFPVEISCTFSKLWYISIYLVIQLWCGYNLDITSHLLLCQSIVLGQLRTTLYWRIKNYQVEVKSHQTGNIVVEVQQVHSEDCFISYEGTMSL